MGLYSCAFGRDCEDWVHIFVCLWDFLVWWLHMNMVVVEGSLVDILVQLMDSLCGKFLVCWVYYSGTHPFRGFC